MGQLIFTAMYQEWHCKGDADSEGHGCMTGDTEKRNVNASQLCGRSESPGRAFWHLDNPRQQNRFTDHWPLPGNAITTIVNRSHLSV